MTSTNRVATLDEVADIQSGFAFPSKNYSETGYFLVRIGNVQDGEINLDNPRFVELEKRTEKFELRPGDFLTSLTGNIGRVARVNETHLPAALNQRVARLRITSKHALPDYVGYFLQSGSFGERLRQKSHGAAQANVSPKEIASIPVPLPPLDEQKRIVAVLDQALAALDRARTHAEVNLADAKQFFVNSLRALFSNESTKWASTTDAAAITSNRASTVARTRSKASTQTGGREAATRRIEGDYSLSVLQPDAAARPGWIWSSLSDLARLESGHTPSRKHPEYWGGTIGWLGIRDARDHHGGEIFETSEQTNDLGIANSSARILPAGTVCLSRTASVGYVVKMGVAMSTSQDFVNWICGEQLEPDFLMLLLLAQGQDIRRFASGSVHQTIYFPEVKAFHICHPSTVTQREICKSFKEIRVRAVSLIEAYEQKLADLTNLRQSLLQKAFSGQLT